MKANKRIRDLRRRRKFPFITISACGVPSTTWPKVRNEKGERVDVPNLYYQAKAVA